MSDTSFTANAGPPLPDNDPPKQPPIVKKPRRGCLLPILLLFSHVVLLVFGLGVGILIGSLFVERQPAHARGSIAILPFTGDWNPEGAKDPANFLQVTLPDEIAREMVKNNSHGALKVIATHETRHQIWNNASPRQVGSNLNVSAVLSGKVSKDGQLSLQLIATNSGELLWSNNYRIQIGQAGVPRLDGNAHNEIADSIRRKLAK